MSERPQKNLFIPKEYAYTVDGRWFPTRLVPSRKIYQAHVILAERACGAVEVKKNTGMAWRTTQSSFRDLAEAVVKLELDSIDTYDGPQKSTKLHTSMRKKKQPA